MARQGKQRALKSLLEKLLHWGVIGMFAVLPLLYFPGRAASYVTSKEYFFIGAVDVLAALWVWLLLRDARYRLSKKNLLFLTPLFLFLLSLTVSAVVGVDPATSFLSTVESGTGLLLLYHAALFTCITTSLIRVRQKVMVRTILQANFFASVVLAIATFFTGPNGVWNIGSTMLNGSSGGAMMGNVLLVGAYFIFSLFLTVSLITQERNRNKKVLYYVGIVLIILSPVYFNAAIFKGVSISHLSSGYLFIGQARIAAAALMAGVFASVCIWASLGRHKLFRRLGIAGLILGIALFAYGIHEVMRPDSSLHRFFIAQSGNRLIDWQESIKGIEAKPAFGWGPENFHVVYQQYLDPVVFSPGHGNEVWALHPHNNTFEVLVDGGIIGFIFYLLVWAGLIFGIFRLYQNKAIDRKMAALLLGLLIAFVAQQQMIYDSIVSYVMFFFIIALLAGLMDMTDEPRPLAVSTPTASYVIEAVAVLVLALMWLYGAYLPARKVEEFQRVADMTSDRRAPAYSHLFHSAGSYTINTDAEFFTSPLFYSYDAQKQQLKANPVYQKYASAEIRSLLTAVDPVWQHNPYDYHLSLSLVELDNLEYYLNGGTTYLTDADRYAARAFALSPTDPQIYFAYAQTLVYENKTDQAKAMLDKATALNPDYQAAAAFRKLLK